MSRELIEDNFKKLTKAVNESDIDGAIEPAKILASKVGIFCKWEKNKFINLLAELVK